MQPSIRPGRRTLQSCGATRCIWGDLAFVMSHRVNGVSALHTELVRTSLFPDLHRLYPDRIVNQTNGITPRRWLKLANPGLSALVTRTIGPGWEADLDRLKGLEAHIGDPAYLAAFRAIKRANKAAVLCIFKRLIFVG